MVVSDSAIPAFWRCHNIKANDYLIIDTKVETKVDMKEIEEFIQNQQ
jgi:hypothetical protein